MAKQIEYLIYWRKYVKHLIRYKHTIGIGNNIFGKTRSGIHFGVDNGVVFSAGSWNSAVYGICTEYCQTEDFQAV